MSSRIAGNLPSWFSRIGVVVESPSLSLRVHVTISEVLSSLELTALRRDTSIRDGRRDPTPRLAWSDACLMSVLLSLLCVAPFWPVFLNFQHRRNPKSHR